MLWSKLSILCTIHISLNMQFLLILQFLSLKSRLEFNQILGPVYMYTIKCYSDELLMNSAWWPYRASSKPMGKTPHRRCENVLGFNSHSSPFPWKDLLGLVHACCIQEMAEMLMNMKLKAVLTVPLAGILTILWGCKYTRFLFFIHIARKCIAR